VTSQQYESPPGHAFISYVHDDHEPVARLHLALEASGIRVWRDAANIWPGQDWKLEVRNAIADGSLAFVACFSANSMRREKSYQNEELILAAEEMRLRTPGRSWLIPVRFSECEIPPFDLGAGRTFRSLQFIDLFGDSVAPGTSRLISAVLRILGRQQIAAVHLGRGRALREQGQAKDAEAAFQEAIRVDRTCTDAHLGLGRAQLDQGHPAEAEESFREAIRSRPADAAGHAQLGAALSQQGRHIDAESAFRKAAGLAPDDPAAYLHLGDSLSALKRYRDAEGAYRQAILLDPADAPTYSALACVLDEQGRYSEMEQVCRQAVNLDQASPSLRTLLGDSLRKLDRQREAQECYRHAIRLCQDLTVGPEYVKASSDAYRGLGLTSASMEQFEEAESALRAAIAFSPGEPSLYTSLGQVLCQQERYWDAEAVDRESIRLDSSWLAGYLGLGHDLLKQRRFREAAAAYREAVRLDPSNAEAHHNLKVSENYRESKI
jgi:tetratricopeptide (TPR) repeat protein